jgi:DNA-binding NarL/FixJ family response regulator
MTALALPPDTVAPTAPTVRDAEAGAPPLGSPPGRPVPRLVLGDGSRLFVDALSLALASHGRQVAAVATTRRAVLRAVLINQPQICMLDVLLADGDAIDVIDRIHERLPQVKVLVLATDTGPGVVAAAIEAGAVGYLSKRHGIVVIDDALDRATRGEFVIDPDLAQETLRHLRDHREVERNQPMRWLTKREREVLRRLTEGDGTAEIAHRLGMTTNTARTHVQNMLDKLGVHSRLEAVALANRVGLDDPIAAGTRRTGHHR